MTATKQVKLIVCVGCRWAHSTRSEQEAGRGNVTMDRAIYLTNMIGESIIAFVSVVGNGVVLLLIAKEKHLQTVTNYFVASLAAADLLVGAIGIPCVFVAIHDRPYNSFMGCLTVNSMIVVLTQISIFGLLAIAIERFYAIRSPFSYNNNCNGKLALVVISVSWVAAILVGLVPLFGWNNGNSGSVICSFVDVISYEYMVYFNFFVCVLGPLVLIFLIYCYIYKVVRNQLRQIDSLQIRDTSDSSNAAANTGVKSKLSQLKKDINAAKWFAIVIFVFALCWLPLHIMNTITLLAGKVHVPTLTAFILLSHANSAMNPALYSLGNKKFQRAMKKLFLGARVDVDLNMSATVQSINATSWPLFGHICVDLCVHVVTHLARTHKERLKINVPSGRGFLIFLGSCHDVCPCSPFDHSQTFVLHTFLQTFSQTITQELNEELNCLWC